MQNLPGKAPENPSDLLFSSFQCLLRTTDRPDFPVTEHWHYFAEIIRVRTGSLKVHRGSKAILLNAGDAIFFTPMIHHSVDYGEAGVTATYELIRLDMEQFGDLPSFTPDLRGMILEAERQGVSMVFTGQELREMHADFMISQCIEEYRNQDYGYDLRIRSFLYLIFTHAVRLWFASGFTPQRYGARLDPIYSLPTYIFRHIQDPLKVEDLARYCGLSYPWFARKFHQIYGASCKEYIEKVRIRRVEYYLQFTDCDLNYISQNTGYSDCSHLVRDFRKLRNTTPGQFRQAYRQKPQPSGQFPQNY